MNPIRVFLPLVLTFSATSALADQLELTGVLRDFRRGDRADGHLDFETAHTVIGHGDYGHVPGLVTMTLSDTGKPLYNPVRPDNDTISSAQSLAQWFTDVPAVNSSKAHAIVLSNNASAPGGVYSYQNNQFFPLDNQLAGNEGLNHNFHFTYELHTKFTYVPGQAFTFIGDDDVWVYVNGFKVIDLGGVHGAVTGSVLLFDGKAFVEKNHSPTRNPVCAINSNMAAKLATKWQAAGLGAVPPQLAPGAKYIDLGLTDHQDCRLDFFFAERHTTQSEFRIDTSIRLVEAADPASASYD